MDNLTVNNQQMGQTPPPNMAQPQMGQTPPPYVTPLQMGQTPPPNMTQPQMGQTPPPYMAPPYGYNGAMFVTRETIETKRMKENFLFFGLGTLLYAIFYAFCMFKNGSGITFPFFIAASILYLRFALVKLGLKLKKGSIFYIISVMLLAVSTFCTDDSRIIFFNKTGIFLLIMSLLLNQFYETKKWTLGKYMGNIIISIIECIGELLQPFKDAGNYFKKNKGNSNKPVWYGVLGGIIAIPLVAFVIVMLSAADAVFRQVAERLIQGINFGNIFEVIFRVGLIFFATYLLISYMCKRTLNTEVKDNRRGEPALAITINGMLTVIYLVFSVIQILYLFMGQMKLPEGYTYAMYAREGFFQLLVVSVMNLVIVLVSMSYFRESKVLKCILTIMSLCTFIMIASSALRMIIYIRFYYMTFLRILVLWALALLLVLFMGVIFTIFKKDFPLFRYSMVVVTVLYLMLSFSHPDYIIAKINIANAHHSIVDKSIMDDESANVDIEQDNGFFLAQDKYDDYNYLSGLCADAAPVIIPYLDRLGYDVELFYEEDEKAGSVYRMRYDDMGNADTRYDEMSTYRQSEFGYVYLRKLQDSTKHFGPRTYNFSRHIALMEIEKIKK